MADKTYRVTAPDGKDYEFSGSGTPEQALQHFQNQWQEKQTAENYGNEGRAYPESTEATKPVGDRIGSAIGGALVNMAGDVNKLSEMTPVGAILKKATGNYVGNKLDEASQRYANLKPYLGTAGDVADIGTQVAATAVPIAKGGAAIGKIPALVKTLGRAAPAVGDIAANAAYSGGKTAVEGGDIGDIATSTLEGAAGAAVPHAVVSGAKAAGGAVVGSVLKKARAGVTPEAKALLDEGIDLTPGQMGGGNWMTKTEEAAKKYVPFLGSAIERAQGNAGGQVVRKAVNDALAPTEQAVKGTGFKALDEAHGIIDDGYKAATDKLYIHPEDLRANLVKLDQNLPMKPSAKGEVGTSYGTNPGEARGGLTGTPEFTPASTMELTEKQSKKLYEVVTDHITPALEQAEANGTTITGRKFKDIDSKIGDLAREQITAGDSKMGEAYYELQRQLRSSLSATELGGQQELLKMNMAFKNMLDVQKSILKAKGGIPSAEQLLKQNYKSGNKPTQFTKDAAEVFSNQGKGNARGLSGAVMLGAGLVHPSTALGLAGGYAASHAYSPSGIRAMANALVPEQRAAIMGAPVNQRAAMLKKALASSPISARQAAAQAGRATASGE